MNKKLLAIVAVGMALLTVGCSDVPQCSDNDVQELVLDIGRDYVWEKENYYPAATEKEKEMEMEKRVQEINQFIDGEINRIETSPVYENATKEQKEKKKADIKKTGEIQTGYIKASYEYALKVTNSLKLISIRTDSVDENTNKSSCKAQFTSASGKVLDITYTAQKTSDDEIFVEVYGL